jgi:hypothetical protein
MRAKNRLVVPAFPNFRYFGLLAKNVKSIN